MKNRITLSANLKNKQTESIIAVNFFIAISYAVFGFLADLLTVQTSDASAIWPSAGIALAACLIWGRGVWPGIFMGAFIINIWIAFDSTNNQAILSSVLLVSMISFGAVLQALIGYFLITKSSSQPNSFQTSKQICKLLCFGGAFSCIVGASTGVSGLFLAGFISGEQFFTNWLTWWLGDSIGVILFAPITLVFFAKPRDQWGAKVNSVAIPLLIASFLVVVIFSYANEQEQKQKTVQFEKYTTDLFNKLKNRINKHQESLYMIANFFEHTEYVSQSQFREFTKRTLKLENDIQALAWVQYVRQSERQQFVQGVKDEGFNNFKIFDKQTPLTKAPQYKEYAVITYIEPLAKNTTALGMNILSDNNVAATLFKAITTKDTVITPGIELIQGKSKGLGFVIYQPVYKNSRSLAGPVIKGNTPTGYVACVLYLDDLIKTTLTELDSRKVFFRIYDQTISELPQLLYSNQKEGSSSKKDSFQQQFTIADRQWLIYSSSVQPYQGKGRATWVVLLSVLILMTMFSAFLLALSGRSFIIKKSVDNKTKDLEQINYILNKTNQALASTNKKLHDSEFQFRKLVQTQSAIVWRYDLALGEFTFVSDEAENLLGYSNEQWFEKDFWINHIHSNDRQQARNYTLNAVKVSQKYDFEYRMLKKTGEIVWIKDMVNVVLDNGVASELVGVMIDISAQHKAEEDTRLAATTFETLEGITIADANSIVLKVNHAFTVITGYSEEESVGQHMNFLKSGHQDAAFYADLWKQLNEKGRFEGEIWNRRKNGEIFPEWITITAVKDHNDNVTHYVGIFSDITVKKASEDEIRSLAFYDPLTNLPNRRLLLDRIQQEIIEAKRTQYFGIIIFLDLDRFKLLNDSLGHHIGDKLLIQVSQRLKSVLRDGDTASRLGGDEFVVLLPMQGKTAESAADKAIFVAEKIRVLLNKPYVINHVEHTFSCSLGVAIFPEDSDEAATILQQADTAMYLSKEKGKNCISFYHSSMQETADKRLLLENELRLAISNHQLRLFYQPQVDELGNIVSAEALIRWVHPEKGLISPADFIPIAEESSLILPVGKWVINEACRQIQEWERLGFTLNHIAINVSSRQFKQQDFVEEVRAAIIQHGIAANQLTIELTESIVADDINDTVNKMNALKALGIKISIDDFGTGYSSLSYLKQLPLDQLKIDQSFVRDINIDSGDTIIVETIINMANNLGLNVIAEGVETKEQAHFLKEKGCKNYQGYYYGRPMPAEEFIAKS
ncbi:MAG: EAL domain-containing protein [Methylococcales bacterium]